MEGAYDPGWGAYDGRVHTMGEGGAFDGGCAYDGGCI